MEQRAQAAKLEESKSQKLYCHFCKKKFGSEKSYENHLPSKKHQENVLINPDRENQNVAKSSEKAVEKINIDDEEELEEEMVEDDEEWEDYGGLKEWYAGKGEETNRKRALRQRKRHSFWFHRQRTLK